MSRPYSSDPYQRGSVLSRSFVPIALITLGVVFLLSNLVPDGHGGLILIGLGAAFMVGRLTTGRYGYAVPAGILIAIGAYSALQSTQSVHGIGSAGLFFVLLGLGFVLIYAIGLRPTSIWPVFPAAILACLGGVMLGVASLGPLASLSWIVAYWPLALVLVGVWFLLRDSLPAPTRRPIATLGGLGLLAYGILAAAAAAAAGGTLAQPAVSAGFGSPPWSDTLTLELPIEPGQTFTANNSSGRTTIHGAAGSVVHVVATRRLMLGAQGPEVRLVPTSNGVTLDSSGSRGRFPFGDAGSIDYTVDVPSSVAVRAQSTSGALEIDGVTGTVEATTTSGSIKGTGLQHVHQVRATSGHVSLEGMFTEAAEVNTTSGSVNLKLLPGTNVQLDVHTRSGSIQPSGLALTGPGAATRRDTLTGAIGTPASDAALKIQTSSGSVIISQ